SGVRRERPVRERWLGGRGKRRAQGTEQGREEEFVGRDGEVARLMEQDPASAEPGRARRQPEEGLCWRGASREGRGRRREAWRSLMAAETGGRARWKARVWGSLATSSAAVRARPASSVAARTWPANSRGGGECGVRELQGWRPRAPGGSGVRGGRELQWNARRQGGGELRRSRGGVGRERKRENGRER
ncbi:hypothetical protein PVAP13_1NG133638, partial [Panicum virgatum]